MGCIVGIMKTISEYLKTEMADPIATAVKESEKAIAVKIEGEMKLAWFPKSVCKFLKDDFYDEKQDKWMLPKWLVAKKAAELGVMPYRIG
jgi:hypothetical protein